MASPYELLKLVRDFGEPLVLRKHTYGSYNPAAGSQSSASYTDHDFTGYFYVYQITSMDELARGTRKCVIPALGLAVTPDDEDQVLGNGDTVNITRVLTMFTGGTPICHICDVSE